MSKLLLAKWKKGQKIYRFTKPQLNFSQLAHGQHGSIIIPNFSFLKRNGLSRPCPKVLRKEISQILVKTWPKKVIQRKEKPTFSPFLNCLQGRSELSVKATLSSDLCESNPRTKMDYCGYPKINLEKVMLFTMFSTVIRILFVKILKYQKER